MKRKTEFSKKIFIGVSVATIIVVVFTMVMIWRTNDTSVLAYLIPALFAELATATGFYYNKAREENIRKIERSKEKYENKLETETDKP